MRTLTNAGLSTESVALELDHLTTNVTTTGQVTAASVYTNSLTTPNVSITNAVSAPNISVLGQVTSSSMFANSIVLPQNRSITFTPNTLDHGVMMEKSFASGWRFGMGQFPMGRLRLYANATLLPTSGVYLSLHHGTGTAESNFVDLVSANAQGIYLNAANTAIAGSLTVGGASGNVVLQNQNISLNRGVRAQQNNMLALWGGTVPTDTGTIGFGIDAGQNLRYTTPNTAHVFYNASTELARIGGTASSFQANVNVQGNLSVAQNAVLSGNVAMGTDRTFGWGGTSTLRNNMIVLWSTTSLDQHATNYYGFGLSGGQLRYHSQGQHVFYNESNTLLTLMNDGIISNRSLTMGPNLTIGWGSTTYKNNMITLYGINSTSDSTNYYGFGINLNVLRYQTDTSGQHVFYNNTTPLANIALTGITFHRPLTGPTGSITVASNLAVTGGTLSVGDTRQVSFESAVPYPNLLRFAGSTLLTSTDAAAIGTETAALRYGVPSGSAHKFFAATTPIANLQANLVQVYANTSITGNLNVTNTILAGGDIGAYSDRRLKSNLEVVSCALARIRSLTGYTFDRIDMPQRRYAGLLAQDLLPILPEAVFSTKDDTLAIAYGTLSALYVEAIKELDARLAAVEKKVSL